MTYKIKNWSQFQHFKDRRPPWVKLYRDLLDDIDWHQLDPEAAKVLVMLWLIASETDGVLPENKKLAFRLRLSEKVLSHLLNKLSHWLDQVDINVISERYQSDAPETETETETYKQEEEKDIALCAHADSVSEVFTCWKTTFGHEKAKLDEKRKKSIRSALLLGYSVEDLCNAISGCSQSPFHMGENQNGQRYDALDLILRNAEKIDQFIGFYRNPPKPINGKTQRQIDSEATTRAIFGDMLTPIERVISGEVVK